SFVRTPAGIAVLVVAAVAVGVALWRVASAPALPRDINVAVLLPQTPGANEDFSHFARGLMSHVSWRLRRHADTPGFQMATFSEVSEEGAKTASDSRKSLGTNVALISILEQTPD